jgi:hypothetical protein
MTAGRVQLSRIVAPSGFRVAQTALCQLWTIELAFSRINFAAFVPSLQAFQQLV